MRRAVQNTLEHAVCLDVLKLLYIGVHAGASPFGVLKFILSDVVHGIIRRF